MEDAVNQTMMRKGLQLRSRGLKQEKKFMSKSQLSIEYLDLMRKHLPCKLANVCFRSKLSKFEK